MNRRTLLITALPLAIVLAFGALGVVASRAGWGDGRSEDGDDGGLPFAIAEPVKANWNPTAAAEASFTLQITPPAGMQARSYELTREKIDLDDTRDVRIGKSTLRGPDFAVLVNNGSKAQRVEINGLVANDCTEYGGYVDGASDWWIRNSVLHQAKDASQHGLRIASGTRFRISDSVIDARGGDKTTLWVLNGSDIELRNVKLLGGRSWFSIDPENPNLPDGHVRNVVIADCWIDLDQDWPNAMEFMPGADGVTITNLHVRSARPPLGVWTGAGGVAAAKNVRWKDIWIPAPGQPADKPFDELEWVKLREDDFERIVSHKGQSLTDLAANGIGPLEPAAH